MRFVSTLAALALMVLSTQSASAQSAEDAFGTWRHPENGSTVSMYKCGAGLCAKIASVNDGQKTDDKNPDEGKRKRSIVGLQIMSGASKDGDKSWSGDLYNRTDGKTYSGTVTVKSKSSLELKGCSLGVFCKTVTWSRVN
jgi:uncharacterized protein (DUF2147 family)